MDSFLFDLLETNRVGHSAVSIIDDNAKIDPKTSEKCFPTLKDLLENRGQHHMSGERWSSSSSSSLRTTTMMARNESDSCLVMPGRRESLSSSFRTLSPMPSPRRVDMIDTATNVTTDATPTTGPTPVDAAATGKRFGRILGGAGRRALFSRTLSAPALCTDEEATPPPRCPVRRSSILDERPIAITLDGTPQKIPSYDDHDDDDDDEEETSETSPQDVSMDVLVSPKLRRRSSLLSAFSNMLKSRGSTTTPPREAKKYSEKQQQQQQSINATVFSSPSNTNPKGKRFERSILPKGLWKVKSTTSLPTNASNRQRRHSKLYSSSSSPSFSNPKGRRLSVNSYPYSMTDDDDDRTSVDDFRTEEFEIMKNEQQELLQK